MARPLQNDFDPYALTKQIDDHARDMASINKRVEDLEKRFGSNEQIAQTLCIASEKAVEMQEMFEKNFLRLLIKNEETRNAIKKLIQETDRNYVQAKFKEYGIWITGLFLFLGAQISIETIKWLVSLIHSAPH